ncbi:putative RDD family membrane protein YckC [Methanofollis sp. W23]|uniref:RDD family protein n=1 Tax=Methanofollis sp. W23 TaxID=2817849 RepID=UPI001AE1B4C0|nr:RDD family protein [Methanofollis sp. W23]MBP2146229.1 putative RDD family membrane protein YckC [Methanofollis sp. W23]
MYCQTCGEPLPDDSLYCSSCGRRLGAAVLQADEEPVEYAGFIRRFVAYIVDALIFVAVSFLLIMMVFIVLGAFMEPSQIISLLIMIEPLIYILSFTTFYFYCAYLESSPRQATVGKRALGIAVTDADGERITFGRATGRFIGKQLSGLFFPVFIIIALTQKKQGLHDMATDTLVVKKRV